MASWLNDSMSWLADTLEASTAELVTYARGSESIAILMSPLPGQASRSAIADGRVQFEVRSMDFDVDPALIVFGSVRTDPQRGDRIAYAGGVYEVTPRSGEPEFGGADFEPYGHRIRVRTTRVA